MIIENGFDFDNLRSMALCQYVDSPKAMTLMQHTMLADTTEVFCIDENKNKIQIFVPNKNFTQLRVRKVGTSYLLKLLLRMGRRLIIGLWFLVNTDKVFFFLLN